MELRIRKMAVMAVKCLEVELLIVMENPVQSRIQPAAVVAIRVDRVAIPDTMSTHAAKNQAVAVIQEKSDIRMTAAVLYSVEHLRILESVMISRAI